MTRHDKSNHPGSSHRPQTAHSFRHSARGQKEDAPGRDELLEKVLSHYKAKALFIIDQGKATALGMLEQSRNRANEENDNIRALELKRIEDESRKEREIIRTISTTEILRFKEEHVQKVVVDVRRKLYAMPESLEQYDVFMRALIAKGHRMLGPCIMLMNSRDIPRYGDSSTTDSPIPGGVILVSTDSKKELRYDFDTLLEDAMEELVENIDAFLFGDEHG